MFMYSLFIDSHDSKVSVVLFKNGKVIVEKLEESNNKHSTIVMPLIREVIESQNIDIKDINEDIKHRKD